MSQISACSSGMKHVCIYKSHQVINGKKYPLLPFRKFVVNGNNGKVKNGNK